MANCIVVTALIVCVDYADYLALTLPRNVSAFSDLLVITTPDDVATHRVCQANHVRFLTTDAFYKDGALFNKAAGLNVGMHQATTDYLCTLDADTLLPGDFEMALATICDPIPLYGMNRVVYETLEDWKLRRGEDRHMPEDYIVGFMQMFNRNSPYYPGRFCENYPTAGHYDLEFSAHWPVQYRRHLPGNPAAHIGRRGEHWLGRKLVQSRQPPRHQSHMPTQTRSSITCASSGFRLVYLDTSNTLLLQNTSNHLFNHVRLTLPGLPEPVSYRLGTMQPGSFVELFCPKELVGCHYAQIRLVDRDGSALTSSLVISRATTSKSQHVSSIVCALDLID